MHKYRSVILFSLVLCLCNCSTKMAYNYLDWAIQWKARSLVPLNATQKQQTKLASIAFHNWHQTTQLPLYADFLSDLKQRLQQGPISPQDIDQATDRAQVLLDQAVDQALPDIVALISELDDKQIRALEKSFKDERDDYIDDYVDISPQKQLKKRYDDLVDVLDPWFGRFTDEQKQLVQHWTQQLKPYEQLNLLQQNIWATEFNVLLENRTDKIKLHSGLKKLFYVHSDKLEPELQAILEHNQELSYKLLSTLVNSLTPKQKQNFLDKLDDYIKICRELAAEKTNKI